MSLVLLIQGNPELRMAVGYLIGAILVFVITVVIAGIVFGCGSRGNRDFTTDDAWFTRLRLFPREIQSILDGQSARRGSLMFLSLCVAGTGIILILLALVVPCLCSGLLLQLGYIAAAVFALLFLALGLRAKRVN